VNEDYDGRQYVGIDLHRRRSVIVRMTPDGEQLGWVRCDNDPVALGLEPAKAGPDPEVVLKATYGWSWAVDVLQAAGAQVHLAHPLGVKGFAYRRAKNDVRDAADLADLLRMGRLPEAYIATPHERELRELVRHRAKLVADRARDFHLMITSGPCPHPYLHPHVAAGQSPLIATLPGPWGLPDPVLLSRGSCTGRLQFHRLQSRAPVSLRPVFDIGPTV
jgi:hypothetical protein